MTSQLCSVCSRPGEIYCEKCDDIFPTDTSGPPISYRTWYCGVVCRFIDTSNHAAKCSTIMDDKALRKAELVGEIAQDLFNSYLDKTWAHDIHTSKVDYQGGQQPSRVTVTAAGGYGAGSGKETMNERIGGGWYVQLPFPQRVHKQAKAAVLANGNSIWQLVVMTNVVRVLFEDLVNDPVADIKEVIHTPNPDLKRVVHHISRDEKPITLAAQPYPDDEQIGVFEITLYSGFKVALSLAGRQYTDFHEPVRPWGEYMSTYGTPEHSILTRCPNGTAQRQHYKLLESMTQLSRLHVDKALLKQLENYMLSSQVIKHIRRLLMIVSLHSWPQFKKRFVAPFNTFLAEVIELLSKAPISSNSSPLLTLAHPSTLQDSVFYKYKRHLRLYDYGTLLAQNFNWDLIKDIAKDKKMGFESQKEARAVLGNRTLVAPWADGKLLFLQQQILYGDWLVNGQATENPHYDRLRKSC